MDFDLSNLPAADRGRILKLLGEQKEERLEVLDDQNRYVDLYLNKKGIKVSYSGAIEWRDHPGINKANLLTMIHKEFLVWCVKNKIAPSNRLKKGDLGAHFDNYIHNQRAELIRKLRSKVGFHTQFDDKLGELARFVDCLLVDQSAAKKEFATTIMHSFIWQVKRKILGLSVEHHVMPVLYSSVQGIGKSESVFQLLKPLDEFTMSLQLDVFSDTFMKKSFAENFVIVFDEMTGYNRADVEAMKNAITAKTLSARGMRTQDVDNITQNCTFIGTSNKRIQDTIFDSTGMRRFAEIELSKMSDLATITGTIWKGDTRENHANPIDFLQIWRSVDESKLNPVLAIASELLEHQSGLTTQTTYLQWIKELELQPGSVQVAAQQLYAHYRDWMETQGKKAGMKQRFNRELVSLGFEQNRAEFGLSKAFLIKGK